MKKIEILIVEGNLPNENKNFQNSGIQTHAESLKESLSYYSNDLNIEVFNPCEEKTFDKIIPNIKKYDGLIWGGSSLNIYNDCIEIRRQIAFMKECFKNIKKILAICWGMQVAVTAAGGEVKKSSNGAHIGIANDIEINEKDLDIERLSKMAFEDPSTGGNPKKLSVEDMRMMYAQSMSGKLF